MKMGRFARFAQAAHLLGRVLRHTSDKATDIDFHEQEGIQLYRTLRALVGLSEAEAVERNIDFCTQAATCYRCEPADSEIMNVPKNLQCNFNPLQPRVNPKRTKT